MNSILRTIIFFFCFAASINAMDENEMSDAPTLDECFVQLNFITPRLEPNQFTLELGHELFAHKEQFILLATLAEQSNESADRLVAYEAKRKAARIEQFLCQNGYYMNVD